MHAVGSSCRDSTTRTCTSSAAPSKSSASTCGRPSDEQDLARRLRAHVATRARRAAGSWAATGITKPGRASALPTRAPIDAATPRPSRVRAAARRPHGLANSLAMQARRRHARRPRRPTAARSSATRRANPPACSKTTRWTWLPRAIPPDSLEETIEKARAALAHAASLGVTTIQDMTASATELRAYQPLRAAGRADGAHLLDPEPCDRGAREAGMTSGFGDDWLRIGGIKLFADGSMGSGTAAFFEPYADDPSTSGLLHPVAGSAGEGDLRRRCRRLPARRPRDRRSRQRHRPRHLRASWHANEARATGAPRIEHAQVVRDADKTRFKALASIASIQPSHCIDDMRWAETRIGRAAQPHRLRLQVVRRTPARG